ncbi:MAG: type II toxin-antitoxin system VapC family toxin [Kiritimatiellae bacterium]|nr:type II toxin-antitoxin system VapC family toxin [Kiritimatiellia bacterium]
MRYLVDTNILIYLCNSKSAALEKRFTDKPAELFYVSAITVGELIYGVKKSQRQAENLRAILKILSPFSVLDFNSEDGWEYGAIRAELECAGSIIGGNDLLIAAQARSRGLTVITNNFREFSRVEGLSVEDWLA